VCRGCPHEPRGGCEGSCRTQALLGPSQQDLAANGGRELSNYSTPATREVEGLVFKLANSAGQLRKLVDVLGSAKDTVDHRRRIAEVNAATQEVSLCRYGRVGPYG
jgi:hypothetical protein